MSVLIVCLAAKLNLHVSKQILKYLICLCLFVSLPKKQKLDRLSGKNPDNEEYLNLLRDLKKH